MSGLCKRRGLTLVETTAALGVLGSAAVLAAQLGVWCLIERARTNNRLAVMDATANIIEAARAQSWSDLTPEWAAGQRLPESLTVRLVDGTLSVRVTPEPDRPHVKRVSVEIQWEHKPSVPAQSVALVGLFAERSAGGGT